MRDSHILSATIREYCFIPASSLQVAISFDAYDDMLDTEKHKFPIEKMLKHGLRSMVSNKKLKLALGQFLTATVVLIFLMTYSGTHAAKTKTSFPIYSDDSGVYAVVYNNGQAFIMESATVTESTITIDTTREPLNK